MWHSLFATDYQSYSQARIFIVTSKLSKKDVNTYHIYYGNSER